MDKYISHLTKQRNIIANSVDCRPRIGIVLGSGLGTFADNVSNREIVDYSDLPSFPVSTVPGHKGRFVFGSLGGVDVVLMQGRVHYYEGYTPQQVVMPIRLMGLLGVQTVIITNSSAGINKFFNVGDLMMLDDHILYNVPSPLIGKNYDMLGPRFLDMSSIYDLNLRRVIMHTAESLGITMRRGVYMQVSGPNYETPAEIRAFAAMGADAVGMSTAIEAIAAYHMGMRVSAISCISNLAAGISPRPLSHEEVQTAADRAAPKFKALLTNIISKL